MAVEETIAVVGFQSGNPSILIERLKNQDFRLLIIPSGEGEKVSLNKQFGNNGTKAEIEVLDCAKDGCWEADIIAFLNPVDLGKSLLDRIKEVAIQKPVLYIFEEASSEAEEKAEKLQELFPHSRIIKVELVPEQDKVAITGKDSKTVEQISEIFEKAGFTYSGLFN